jgi:hypothetical protein
MAVGLVFKTPSILAADRGVDDETHARPSSRKLINLR